jgi:hypothetical protein
MTPYFHFLFTSLDLGVLKYTPTANITAFQLYKPGDFIVGSLLAEWNIKNTLQKKPIETFLTVCVLFSNDSFLCI